LKLHAVAKIVALGQCLNDLSVDFQFSADGLSANRQQVFEQVKERLELAYSDAEQYLPENSIVVGEINYTENPYRIESYKNWFGGL
jgi:hypothetical protein